MVEEAGAAMSMGKVIWGTCSKCGGSVWFTAKNLKINPQHRWRCGGKRKSR